VITDRLRAITPHQLPLQRVLSVVGAGCLDVIAIGLTTTGGLPFAIIGTALAALGWAVAGHASVRSPRRTFSRLQRKCARTDRK
jgi:hypothetical protein